MEKEIWNPIKGYEGLYEVSSLGRIRRIFVKSGKVHYLKTFKRAQEGYIAVNLSSNNSHKTFNVHRLVALAFLPNQNGYEQINHKDENKQNPMLSNLEWCSASYNASYGTASARRREKLRNREEDSKQIAQYDLNGNLIHIFPSIHEANRITGIARVLLRNVANGKIARVKKPNGTIRYKKALTAGGYKWKFIEQNERKNNK